MVPFCQNSGERTVLLVQESSNVANWIQISVDLCLCFAPWMICSDFLYLFYFSLTSAQFGHGAEEDCSSEK